MPFFDVNFVTTQEASRYILGAILDWLTLIVVIAIIYLLFMLATGGEWIEKLGNLFGGAKGEGGNGGDTSGGGEGSGDRGGGRTGNNRPMPPGAPQNVHHQWNDPDGRYQISWDHRPPEENVVEYQIQRRESPSLGTLATKRFLIGNLFGGWQTIGKSTTNGFDDTGSPVRWTINPRNLTYSGNKTLNPNLAYEYRVRAINGKGKKSPWSRSSEVGSRNQPTAEPQTTQAFPQQSVTSPTGAPTQQPTGGTSPVNPARPGTIIITGAIGPSGQPKINNP